MVKFGSHLQAFLNENRGSNLYVVPYCFIRDEFIEKEENTLQKNLAVSLSDGESTAETVETEAEPPAVSTTVAPTFESEWTACLDRARQDFDQAMTGLWEIVFQGISAPAHEQEARGAPPDRAFRMFIMTAGREATQELLARVNSIYETSLTNSEALRKLVKKFDKKHQQRLSLKLLPKIYASNFTVGQPTLEDGLSTLRSALGHVDYDFDEDEPPQTPRSQQDLRKTYERDRRGQQHEKTVQKRMDELTWLRNLVASIAPDQVSHIVAHRGFHNPMDRSDRRPLENSLAAYEAAWTNGVHLCECDIALTRDEKLVLAHDADFSRLALDKDSPMYNCQVRDLTFRELISLPLKSGIRPPLLIDVLRSARAIGGNSQLIIEIKPGNNDAAKALARLFIRHPDLMEQCAVIMSFDCFAMHTLRNDLSILEQPTPADGVLRPGHRSNMSLGNLALLSIDPASDATGGDWGFVPLGQHRDSFDHFGVGLSLSVRGSERGAGTDVAKSLDSAAPAPPPAPPSSGIPPLPPSSGAAPSAVSPSSSAVSPTSQHAKRPSPLTGSLRKTPSSFSSEKKRRLPKLMLLTVADKPKIPCELQVGVNDLSKIDQWLHREDGSLDGAYLQFQREMIHPQGAANLRALADKYTVGVWMYSHKDPDDYDTFHHLVREGCVSFVNSDLPKGFKKKGFLGLRGVSFGV